MTPCVGLANPAHFATNSADFLTFYQCFSGPAAPPASGTCADPDFNHDGDVDLADFAIAQRLFGACPPQWEEGLFPLPGTDNDVYAATAWDAGHGSKLFVAGSFTKAGSVYANRIATWDGSTFAPLGQGTDGTINALAVFDDGGGPALFAAGTFGAAGGVPARNIAKWNGAVWSPLGDGLFGIVDALTVFDDGDGPALYAAGDIGVPDAPFTHGKVAKWDGVTWSELGFGPNDRVYALAVFNDGSGPALYAGGKGKGYLCGPNRNCLAKWGGVAWSAAGPPVTGTIYSLAAFDDGSGSALYVGGFFTEESGVFSGIAKWDGATWSPSPGGLVASARSLRCLDDGDGVALYLGSGGVTKWDGESWTSLGYANGSYQYVHALTAYDEGAGVAIYAGGSFENFDGVRARNLIKRSGTEWQPVGKGLDWPVGSLIAFDDGNGPALYAAGGFEFAGGTRVNGLGRWDGAAWSALGAGIDGGGVSAFAILADGAGSHLYVGGSFTTADEVSARNVAKWNGSTFSALGEGLDKTVRTMAAFDDGAGPKLYATTSYYDGRYRSDLMRWDGSAWTRVRTQHNEWIDGTVQNLVVFDDGGGEALYAGGDFHLALVGYSLGKWNGSQWSAVGGSLLRDEAVTALAVLDDGAGPALYAAIDVPNARDQIRKWDGAQWTLINSQIGGTVHQLMMFDDGGGPELYVGGSVLAAGQLQLHGVAKLADQQWSPLGSGMTNSVGALAVFDDGTGSALYAGGNFTLNSARVSAYLAKWHRPSRPCP